MKKLAFVFSFIVCCVAFANAQTPGATTDTKDKPVPASVAPAVPNAPVQIVSPQAAAIEANKPEPAKDKSCSKAKTDCNKSKDCCKKDKAAQASGGGCCKKDKKSCHKDKEETKAEPAVPSTPAPAAAPAKVPGDN